jgi:hypothetical protein
MVDRTHRSFHGLGLLLVLTGCTTAHVVPGTAAGGTAAVAAPAQS